MGPLLSRKSRLVKYYKFGQNKSTTCFSYFLPSWNSCVQPLPPTHMGEKSDTWDRDGCCNFSTFFSFSPWRHKLIQRLNPWSTFGFEIILKNDKIFAHFHFFPKETAMTSPKSGFVASKCGVIFTDNSLGLKKSACRKITFRSIQGFNIENPPVGYFRKIYSFMICNIKVGLWTRPFQYASHDQDFYIFRSKPSFATITGKGDNPKHMTIMPGHLNLLEHRNHLKHLYQLQHMPYILVI